MIEFVVVVVVGTGRTMPYRPCALVRLSVPGLGPMEVRIGQLQQAGVGKPGRDRKQPHQQHRECDLASGAGLREGFHCVLDLCQIMLVRRRYKLLIFVKRDR